MRIPSLVQKHTNGWSFFRFSRADLAEWLGGRSRVSEFFSGRRNLSLRQIGSLTENLGIPADLLIARERTR